MRAPKTPSRPRLQGFGLQHPRDARSRAAFAVDGCVPMSSRCRWCRTATTSRRSAPRTGIWGSASLDDARQGRGPACSARAKSAPPRDQREDHRDRVLSDARRSSGPATVRERETRNPIRPHDASRSPSVEWDEARIGMGRKGGDKFGRGTGGLPSPLGEEGGSAKQRRMRAEPQPKTRKGRLRDPLSIGFADPFSHKGRREPFVCSRPTPPAADARHAPLHARHGASHGPCAPDSCRPPAPHRASARCRSSCRRR